MLRLAPTVLIAGTGEAAFEIVTHNIVNAVVATLVLPDMTAVELLTRLRSAGYSYPFIITTKVPAYDAASPPTAIRAGCPAVGPTANLAVSLLCSSIHALRRMRFLPAHYPSVAHTDERVVLAMQLIQNQFAQQGLNSRRVSGELSISHAYFCRLIKMHTGDSFGHLLHKLRVREATTLLRNTELSVKEIAAAVGYPGTQELDRQFRRYSHTHPAMVRKKCKQTHIHVPSVSTASHEDSKHRNVKGCAQNVNG